MKICISGTMQLLQVLGKNALIEIEREQCAISEFLQVLVEKYGDRFSRLVFEKDSRRLKTNIVIMVNDRSHWNLPGRLMYMLQDGDNMLVTQIMSGG